MQKILLLLLLFLLICPDLVSKSDDCVRCDWERAFNIRDTILDVKLSNKSILYNCRSAERSMLSSFGSQQQSITLTFIRNGVCYDTLLPVSEIESFKIGSIGMNPPMVIDIKPVREYFRIYNPEMKTNFLEISGFFGYGGSDESKGETKIGFDNFYYGLEALVAPFGQFFGKDISLALGGELLFEGSRLRIPVMGHLRWTFIGSPEEVDSSNYYPSPCVFSLDNDGFKPQPSGGVSEWKTSGEKDSASYLIRDKAIIYPNFRPYVFLEAGPVFDTGFNGSGSEPSVNPEEHAEFFIGTGLGFKWHWLSVSLSYRFMRLNLRTPCESCPETYKVNTNQSHSVLLKAGWNLSW